MPAHRKYRLPRINPDLLYEDVVDFLAAQRTFKCSLRSMYRYATEGTISPVTGERVHLEVCYGPSRQLRTSVQAWMRFQERLNGVTT